MGFHFLIFIPMNPTVVLNLAHVFIEFPNRASNSHIEPYSLKFPDRACQSCQCSFRYLTRAAKGAAQTISLIEPYSDNLSDHGSRTVHISAWDQRYSLRKIWRKFTKRSCTVRWPLIFLCKWRIVIITCACLHGYRGSSRIMPSGNRKPIIQLSLIHIWRCRRRG